MKNHYLLLLELLKGKKWKRIEKIGKEEGKERGERK
jgi:hypothetical protein